MRVPSPHTDEDDAHAGQMSFASMHTPTRILNSRHETMTPDARLCKMRRDVMQLAGSGSGFDDGEKVFVLVLPHRICRSPVVLSRVPTIWIFKQMAHSD